MNCTNHPSIHPSITTIASMHTTCRVSNEDERGSVVDERTRHPVQSIGGILVARSGFKQD
jgi:hypothetical protein